MNFLLLLTVDFPDDRPFCAFCCFERLPFFRLPFCSLPSCVLCRFVRLPLNSMRFCFPPLCFMPFCASVVMFYTVLFACRYVFCYFVRLPFRNPFCMAGIIH
jgi:hypothetical protein